MKRKIICKNTGKPLAVPAATYYNEELGPWGYPIPVTEGEIMNNMPGRPQFTPQTPMQTPQTPIQQYPNQQYNNNMNNQQPNQFSQYQQQFIPPMMQNQQFMPDNQQPITTQDQLYNDMPAGDFIEEPDTITNPIYLPAILTQYIGKIVRAEFLIGDTVIDRIGRLGVVGASYIILEVLDSDIVVICDLYSIKFVTVITREPSQI